MVAQATTMDEALLLVQQLQELQVRLVLLDGFLTKGTKLTKKQYLAQGGKIAQEIASLFPGIFILGVSGIEIYQQSDTNVTKYAGKEYRPLQSELKQIN